MLFNSDRQLRHVSDLLRSSGGFGMTPDEIKARDEQIDELFADLGVEKTTAPDHSQNRHAKKEADTLALKVREDEEIAIAIANLDDWLREEKPTNSLRRKADYEGMLARKKALMAMAKIQNGNKKRTTNKITKGLASTEAMRFAAESSRGDLSATTVYIDLLRYLPLSPTVTPPLSGNHPDLYQKIQKWRELSNQATACFYQLGTAAIEAETELKAVPFTWNLSQNLWRAAHGSKENDVTYLQHLLKITLKRALGRTPDFWFAYELAETADSTGKPHLHGTLLIKPSEAKRARGVFHQLNSSVTADFKRHALIFSSGKRKIRTATHGGLHTNLHWSLYCMKERGTVRSRYLLGQKTFTATRGVTQAAKAYHDKLSENNR